MYLDPSRKVNPQLASYLAVVSEILEGNSPLHITWTLNSTVVEPFAGRASIPIAGRASIPMNGVSSRTEITVAVKTNAARSNSSRGEPGSMQLHAEACPVSIRNQTPHTAASEILSAIMLPYPSPDYRQKGSRMTAHRLVAHGKLLAALQAAPSRAFSNRPACSKMLSVRAVY